MIGGFNAPGSLFFGWAGQRWNKLALLGGIYIARSLILAWYFVLPPIAGIDPRVRGADRLFVAGRRPAISGAVAEMFGLRWQAVLAGPRLHEPSARQLPRDLWRWAPVRLPGLLHLAWRIGVGLGLAAGILQVAFALIRPSAPPMLKTAGGVHPSVPAKLVCAAARFALGPGTGVRINGAAKPRLIVQYVPRKLT